MLSQTTEYALRAMSCLAYEPETLTPTPKLAALTKVPSNYLAKVLQSLSQADLIVGRRGVGGGYRLARPAADISLLDVVNAIDPVEPIDSCPLGLPNHGGELCALHRCIDDAARALISRFSDMSLSDLIADSGGSRPLCDADLTAQLAGITIGGAETAGMINGNARNINHRTNGNGHGHGNGHANGNGHAQAPAAGNGHAPTPPAAAGPESG